MSTKIASKVNVTPLEDGRVCFTQAEDGLRLEYTDFVSVVRKLRREFNGTLSNYAEIQPVYAFKPTIELITRAEYLFSQIGSETPTYSEDSSEEGPHWLECNNADEIDECCDGGDFPECNFPD